MTEEAVEKKKTQTNSRKFLGIRITALIETVVYLSVLVLANIFWGDGQRFLDVSPHPFWVIILIVTVQYGTIEGVASSLLSTLFLYAGNIPPQSVGETLFEYQIQLAWLPMLWFITSFVLGELRMRIEYEKESLTKQLDEVKNQADTITDAYGEIRKAKEKLEITLAGQRYTAAMSYQNFKALELLKPEQFIKQLDSIVDPALRPIKFSTYFLDKEGLKIAKSYRWSEEDTYRRHFSRKDALYQHIIEQKKVICIAEPEEEKILGQEGVLAGALVDPKTDEAFGMLKIEEIDLMNLNISQIEIFRSLCSLIGASYEQAKGIKQNNSGAIFSVNKKCYTYQLYEILKNYLICFARETNTPLAQISITFADSFADVGFRRLHAMKNFLPESALCFEGKCPEKEIYILLPFHDIKSAKQREALILRYAQQHHLFDGEKLEWKTEEITTFHRQSHE